MYIADCDEIETSCCSFRDVETNTDIPLYHINYKIRISNNIAEIIHEQFYLNDSEKPIKTQYSYPTHFDAVFAGLEMKFGDRVVVSRINERQEAQTMYDEAISSGRTSVMSHHNEGSKDIVSVFLGGIPPKSQIMLTSKFYQILEVDDLSWNLMIPYKIVPRYLRHSLKCVSRNEES